MTTVGQRFVRFTKRTVLIAAIWTGTCAAVLLVAQLLRFRNGQWKAYPISSLVMGRHDITNTGRTDIDQIVDWILELPALVPLLIAFVILVAFWMRLAKIEKTGVLPYGRAPPKS